MDDPGKFNLEKTRKALADYLWLGQLVYNELIPESEAIAYMKKVHGAVLVSELPEDER